MQDNCSPLLCMAFYGVDNFLVAVAASAFSNLLASLFHPNRLVKVPVVNA